MLPPQSTSAVAFQENPIFDEHPRTPPPLFKTNGSYRGPAAAAGLHEEDSEASSSPPLHSESGSVEPESPVEATSPSDSVDDSTPPRASLKGEGQYTSSGASEVSGREAAESPARAAMREMWRFFEGHADLMDLLLEDCDRMTQPDAVVCSFLAPHPI